MIYGGARGGGKSWALLLEPLRHKDNGGFRAMFFRKSTPDLMKPGGLWDTSSQLYQHVGGRRRSQPNLDWVFPSGAQFKFAHLESDRDVEDHRGAQYAYIALDELPQFSETQFWFLLSCNRSTCGVRPYVRATCNPGPGWVKKLIRWWLDDAGRFAREDRAGVIRYFVRADDGAIVWADSIAELQETMPERFLDGAGNTLPPESVVMSLTFIPAKLEDNVALTSGDPGYRAKLANLPMVERKRFLEGDWAITDSAGNFFRPEWFEITDDLPPGRIVRYWDLAGTKRRRSDFTAGVKLVSHEDGTYTVADVRNEKLRPKAVEDLLGHTAYLDGFEVEVHIEQETGASGELLIDNYSRGPLKGFTVVGHSVRNQGTKIDRARPASAAADPETLAVSNRGDAAKPSSSAAVKGHVKVKRGAWNDAFLEQLQAFPDGEHDDMVDAFTGAFSAIQEGQFSWASGRMG